MWSKYYKNICVHGRKWREIKILCEIKISFSLKKMFIYLFRLCWVFIAVCGLSLVAGDGGYSRVVCGLLIAVASLVVEHRL